MVSDGKKPVREKASAEVKVKSPESDVIKRLKAVEEMLE